MLLCYSVPKLRWRTSKTRNPRMFVLYAVYVSLMMKIYGNTLESERFFYFRAETSPSYFHSTVLHFKSSHFKFLGQAKLVKLLKEIRPTHSPVAQLVASLSPKDHKSVHHLLYEILKFLQLSTHGFDHTSGDFLSAHKTGVFAVLNFWSCVLIVYIRWPPNSVKFSSCDLVVNFKGLFNFSKTVSSFWGLFSNKIIEKSLYWGYFGHLFVLMY